MKSEIRSEGEAEREAWYRLATRTAARIRRECATLDAATAERIVRVFRSALRPRGQAGRKPDRATAHAAALWIAGVERCGGLKRHQRGLWQFIYREVIPDYATLDKLTRQYRTQALRRNVKAYLRRKAHKKPRGIRVPTSMSAGKRVVFGPPPVAAN